MLWQRSEPQEPPRHLPPTIPGSDSVRQAALQASWRRDRRVARRRIAWRWVTWYFQRFSPHVLVGVALLIGATYLNGSLSSWPATSDRPAGPAAAVASTPSLQPAAPVVQAPEPPVQQAEETATDLPMRLRASSALEVHAAAPSPPVGPKISPDTLSLKPENWLHSKEP